MSRRSPGPKEIRRLGSHALRIVWDDGHTSEYVNRYLRDHCPCAACVRAGGGRALPVLGRQGGEIQALRIGIVGRYAVGIEWSDGHDSGIFSYETLRRLCACAQCRPVAAVGSATAG